jgi:hypothetical protein
MKKEKFDMDNKKDIKNSADKFKVDAKKPIDAIIKNLQKLSTLGALHEVLPEDKDKIFNHIKKELDKTKKSFNSEKGQPSGFSFD